MTENTKSTREILFMYLSTLSLFVGTAFVSGAIVHTGNISELNKYILIGFIGIALFISGSFAQEVITNKKNLQEEGIFKFFLFSLMLSVGIGMISGGTQHFSDFPLYSSYLIPLGLVLSYIAFLLKNNFKFTKKLLIAGITISSIAIIGFIGLNSFAKDLTQKAEDNKKALCKTSSLNIFEIQVYASAGHDQATCPTDAISKVIQKESINSHDMTSMVFNNQNFIENMIPHHMEAINTSYTIIASTNDNELKSFASNVIKDQSLEVSQMKTWYKEWFGKDYVDNKEYMPMMTKMNGLSNTELERAYIEGMVMHHQGAIQMADKILKSNDIKSDIKTLAQNIITNQNKEILFLNNLIKTKFAQTQSNIPVLTETPKQDTEIHGHSGH